MSGHGNMPAVVSINEHFFNCLVQLKNVHTLPVQQYNAFSQPHYYVMAGLFGTCRNPK